MPRRLSPQAVKLVVPQGVSALRHPRISHHAEVSRCPRADELELVFVITAGAGVASIRRGSATEVSSSTFSRFRAVCSRRLTVPSGTSSISAISTSEWPRM